MFMGLFRLSGMNTFVETQKPFIMIQIYLSNIHCHEETSELSSADEPYVLVAAVNRAVVVNGSPVTFPAFDVIRYGPFEDVDDGETHLAPGISQSFWGIDG